MDTLDSRKEILLKLTVQAYVKSAEPVGSAWLSEHSDLGVSSATVRNELAELEERGYLAQPHTSAGRVPTSLGYKYYVERFVGTTKDQGSNAKHEWSRALRERIGDADAVNDRLRRAAKALAELSGETALVGFAKRDVYYTGLTNLFSKPEFRQTALVTTMSKVLDHLDEVMERVFPQVGDTVGILIGEENPFGRECGTLIVRVPSGGIMALLGPMRMDYDHDWNLLAAATDALRETA